MNIGQSQKLQKVILPAYNGNFDTNGTTSHLRTVQNECQSFECAAQSAVLLQFHCKFYKVLHSSSEGSLHISKYIVQQNKKSFQKLQYVQKHNYTKTEMQEICSIYCSPSRNLKHLQYKAYYICNSSRKSALHAIAQRR